MSTKEDHKGRYKDPKDEEEDSYNHHKKKGNSYMDDLQKRDPTKEDNPSTSIVGTSATIESLLGSLYHL
jgi:hypothetical protein